MSGWDDATLRARIADHSRRERHEAGSPDPTEVQAYVDAVRDAVGGAPAAGPAAAGSTAGARAPLAGRTVVVLGATPELRRAFAAAGAAVLAVDRSRPAWVLYGDWGPGAGELRVQADWSTLDRLLAAPVDAVVGDGVVGNLADLQACGELLALVRSVLAPAGVLVVRQALVPDDLDPVEVRPVQLLADHRAGRLDDAEFGFAVRLLGHLGCCWDRSSGILDGERLTAETAHWTVDAGLTAGERSAIDRYSYARRNLIPAERDWLAVLAAAGFDHQRVPLSGRHWYRYYVVEACRPR